MKVKRHVELDQEHLDKVQEALPGVSLSHILNELLFSFHGVLQENPIQWRSLFTEAARNAKETLSDS